jgi:hypothetical protein
MASQVPTTSEPGFAALLRGIVNDIGDLVKQQIQFARAEIKSDLRKTREAAALLALGAGSAFLSVLFFGLMLAHLINWLTLPAGSEVATVPLWGCHAIVGGVFLVAGAGLLAVGLRLLGTAVPEQTIQTAKENVEWMTNSK